MRGVVETKLLVPSVSVLDMNLLTPTPLIPTVTNDPAMSGEAKHD